MPLCPVCQTPLKRRLYINVNGRFIIVDGELIPMPRQQLRVFAALHWSRRMKLSELAERLGMSQGLVAVYIGKIRGAIVHTKLCVRNRQAYGNKYGRWGAEESGYWLEWA